MDKQDLLNSLRQDIASKLEDSCNEYGLRSITQFTFIARDPDDDKMSIVITTEDSIEKAIGVALSLNTLQRIETNGQ